MATPAEQFIGACSQNAQRLGLKFVLVGVADPATGKVHVVASPGTVENDSIKQAIVEKFGFTLSGADEPGTTEVGWGDFGT